jgi:hypothetical protein
MGISAGPKITSDGLVLHIDPANTKSYSGSGITIYNMVTGGIAGTLVNGPVSDIAYKKTFILDGTNDTIQMQLPSGLVTGSQISISFWAKWKTIGTTTATIQTLVDNQYQVADNIGFFIQDRPDLGSVLEWSTQPNNTINRRVYSTQVVGDGSWHHIVGTNDGIYSRLYVDGYETGTAKTSAGIATTQDILCIGNWSYVYSSPRYLNGSVSNFKIYNKALSATEILNDYFSAKNRFTLNENIVKNGLILSFDPAKSSSYPGTGNTIYDLSGLGYTASILNGPTFYALNGGYFSFDGTNDYIEASSFSGAGKTYFTLNLWFYKPTSWANAYRKLAIIGGSPNTSLYLSEGPGPVFYFGIGISGGQTGPQAATMPSLNQWHMATGTWDGSNVKLYVDGILVGTTSGSGSYPSTFDTSTFKVGYGYGSEYFTGLISQVQLYNRALSATEIQQNFNAMRERYNI